ncbi:MAG: hypothetical protein ACI8PG_004064 [Planctomycetota bacterium]
MARSRLCDEKAPRRAGGEKIEAVPAGGFWLFELLMVGLLGLCLRHAATRGLHAVLTLLAGVVFGLILEWATIEQLAAYQYGQQFFLAIYSVPLSIGMGWGIILYSAALYTDSSTLSPLLRPVADALLALHIDLTMDAVAIRWGMWDWGKGLEHDYFGVPYENFWAWFWVIFFFSAARRLLSLERVPYRVVVAPLGAIVLGVLGVLMSNRFIVSYVPESYVLATVCALLLIALVAVFAQRPRLVRRPHWLARWVPLVFHGYFLGVGLFFGMFIEQPVLFCVGLLMAFLSAVLHRRALFNFHNDA